MSPEKSLTRHHTLETRRRIGSARKGIPRSEDTRRTISASLLGHPVSEEVRQKIRQTKIENNEDIDIELWRSALENDLLPKIAESGFLTEDELSYLEKKFELPREKRRIEEELLERFSIAVARLA